MDNNRLTSSGSEPSATQSFDPARPATHTLSPARTPAEVPASLVDHPRYRVLELIGAGGMGAVYKAEHQLMGRAVALKIINPNLVDSPTTVERFRREVKAAARLAHPNIVIAYDAEQAESSHFLVMEYVEGTSLARLVGEKGPLPVSRACDYARQTALGLQHAFDRGMVHRDIKPQNLMVTPDGQVKVLDFGLARFALESAPAGALLAPPDPPPTPPDLAAANTRANSLTQAGAVLGTPDYMAPEQANDPKSADSRADIYSLGCTLYQMLGGQVPFPGGGTVDKLMRHAWERPTPLGQLRPGLPPPLVQVVERMMAKDPAARYPTAADVAAALRPWCQSVGMFRVVGRDARGRRRKLSVCASTEEEANRFALSSGSVATIDQVTVPPPVPPPRLSLRRSGFGASSCVLFGVVLLFFLGMALVDGDLERGGIARDPGSGLLHLFDASVLMIALGCGGVAVSVVGLCLGLLGVACDERKMAARVGAAVHGLVLALGGCMISLGR
jgi:serine/threonine protein kinase